MYYAVQIIHFLAESDGYIVLFFVVALHYTAGIHYILEGHDTCYLALGLDLYSGLYPVPLWRFLGEAEVWRTF